MGKDVHTAMSFTSFETSRAREEEREAAESLCSGCCSFLLLLLLLLLLVLLRLPRGVKDVLSFFLSMMEEECVWGGVGERSCWCLLVERRSCF